MKLVKLAVLPLLLFLTIAITAQENPLQIFERKSEVYFKFSPEGYPINQLSKIISIDHFDKDLLFAYANKKEFTAFLKTGLNYEILTNPGDLLTNPKMLDKVNTKEIAEWDFYPTYQAYLDMMNQFATDYPDLCQVFSIGTTTDGRQLMMAKISDNIGTKEAEPQFLYTGTMHGDETTGYILLLRLIDYLLENYGVDPEITDIVNNIEIWINPAANPDGTYAGGNNTVNGATRYNANGVDLNRNYPDPEDGPHPDGNEWQPETIAFMQLATENNFVMSGNTHGGAEVLNYPWDTWPQLHADNAWWVFVCREYADTVHVYAPSNYLHDFDNGITNGYAWYSIDGGRQDFMNYFHNCRELTMEISETKLPPANQLPNFWNYNYRSLINYIKQSNYGVAGVVTDINTGEPLQAKVLIEGHDIDNSFVYADSITGFYQRLLDQGTWDLTFSAPGHYPVTIENVQVSRYQTTTLNVQLDAGSLIADFTASATTIPIGGQVDFSDQSFGSPVSWAWSFEGGTPATSAVQNPQNIVYSQTGSFDVTLTVTNSEGDSETISKTDYIIVNAEFLISNQTITTCSGLFYDSGGATGNYNDDEDFTMTILPGTTGAKIIAEFQLFDVEYDNSCDYDWLKIYNGSNTSAPLLGTWCGTDSPGTVQATNSAGSLTFVFHSDYSVTKQGWKTVISCSSPPLLPVAGFTADTTHILMGQSVHFTDMSANSPTSWAWIFPGGSPESSSQQNPVIQYQEAGIYDVTLIVQNQFGSDTKTIEGYITVDSTIGISELLESGLTIFPNPVAGNFVSIKSPSVIKSVELYDFSGKLILQKTCNDQWTQINFAFLAPGLYYLKVFDDSGWKSAKISRIK